MFRVVMVKINMLSKFVDEILFIINIIINLFTYFRVIMITMNQLSNLMEENQGIMIFYFFKYFFSHNKLDNNESKKNI